MKELTRFKRFSKRFCDVLGWVFLVCFASMIVMLVILALWLRFDTRGLPDISYLGHYAETSGQPYDDSCLGRSQSFVAYDKLGRNMRAALDAAVAKEKSKKGVITYTLVELFFHALPGEERPPVTLHIARTVGCSPSRQLDRHLKELRISVQLERRFTEQQRFTILANRLYLGKNIIGVEDAAWYYFHKHCEDLNIGEAALIAGLAEEPMRYSPDLHPERASRRRLQVIEKMQEAGLISSLDAAMATGEGAITVQQQQELEHKAATTSR